MKDIITFSLHNFEDGDKIVALFKVTMNDELRRYFTKDSYYPIIYKKNEHILIDNDMTVSYPFAGKFSIEQIVSLLNAYRFEYEIIDNIESDGMTVWLKPKELVELI